ncbi:alpha/beta hydrolase [Lentzea sp. NPDC059081]|uniref:alpha/beta hydrolase n=1 Tax=Lentzea sp. NPDC059081 TaxID=3346719 RepID=UPI0036863F55
MASTESGALHALLASMTQRAIDSPDRDLTTTRSVMDELSALTAEPTDVLYEEVTAGGRPALWARPLNADPARVILYLHGGAFMGNSMHSHRKLAAHLAKAARSTALVLDFRLAPEHQFPAQLDDAAAAYRWLLAQGFTPQSIATAGDSGGGGLATTTALRLRDENLPLPAAIVALSPWYDTTAGGDTLDTNAEHDPFLSRPLMKQLSAIYLGGASPDAPLANALTADLTGLPPIYITAGSREGLLDDAQRFTNRATAAGVDVTLEVADDMLHVYPLMAGRAPEADETIGRVGTWLTKHLAPQAG